MNKKQILSITLAAIVWILAACNNAEYTVNDTRKTDSAGVVPVDSITTVDTAGKEVTLGTDEDTANLKPVPGKQNATPAPENGYAIVNCPAVMIKGIPGIVMAQVTKKELQTAIRELTNKLYQQDSTKTKAQIAKETYGDSIMLFKKMKVVLEVDDDDIKKISTNNDIVQDFNNRQTLEWQWTIKPLIKKEKTIITFKFYGIDENNNELPVLQKSMSIGNGDRPTTRV